MIYITYCKLHRYFNKVLYYYRQLTQTMSPCSSINFQKMTADRLVKNERSFIFPQLSETRPSSKVLEYIPHPRQLFP